MIIKSKKVVTIGLLLLSAVLTSLSFTYVASVPAWLSLVPLMYVNRQQPSAGFRNGLIYGTALGILCYAWMPGVIANFSGGSLLTGGMVYLVAIIIIALFAMLTNGIAQLLVTKLKKTGWQAALITAVVWVLGEIILSTAFRGMPWLFIFPGSGLYRDTFAIQWAAMGGSHLLSIFIIVFSYLAALLLNKRRWILLWIPIALIVMVEGLGGVMFAAAKSREKTAHTTTIAILCENTDPAVKWNEENGQKLARNLLDLNKKANELHPDIILWTESAVPWTYRPDDDFIKAVNAQTDSATINLVGINSDYGENIVYNSAYAIDAKGKVLGRYDKRFLLDLAEQPLFALSLPFLGTDGFYAEKGNEANALQTPYGKIGVLICNESTLSKAALSLTADSAGFFVNMTNDGWFSTSTLLVNQHFFNARIRAVENRKDMVVNSNNGISGLIKSSGEIGFCSTEKEPVVHNVTVRSNNIHSVFSRFPAMPFVLCVLLLIAGLVPAKSRDNQ